MNHTPANELKMEIQKGTHTLWESKLQIGRQNTQKKKDKHTDRQTDKMISGFTWRHLSSLFL
jgi:hypothetical protein